MEPFKIGGDTMIFFKNHNYSYKKGFDKGEKITKKIKDAEIYRLVKKYESELDTLDQEHFAEIERMENIIFSYQTREKAIADKELRLSKNKKQLEILARKMIEKFQDTTTISADAFSCIDGYRREIIEMK
jgi:phosphopantetheine adenylyltransferase